MPVRLTLLRLVLASPADVESEWKIVAKVVAELNHGLANELGFRIEISTWRTDAFPGFHAEGPQAQIDSTLKIEDSDILLAIFWTRFGTPVADAESGTVHEIRRAIEAWKVQRKPQVMVYFKTAPFAPNDRHEHEQWAKVSAFRDNFPEQGLWATFRTKPQFETQVRLHLTNFIRNRKSARRGGSRRRRPIAASDAPASNTSETPAGSPGLQESSGSVPEAVHLNIPLQVEAATTPQPQVGATLPTPALTDQSKLSASIFENTTWLIGCRRCNQKSKWVRLRADGLVEFRYGNDREFRLEGDDSWRVESNQLIISWHFGYSIETFTFFEPTQVTATGTKSNVKGPLTITRLQ